MTTVDLVQEPARAALSWPEIAGGLAAIMTIFGGALTFLLWIIRREIRAQIAPTREAATRAADRLKTSNGQTVGDYAEATAAGLERVEQQQSEMRGEIGVLTGWYGENRDLAHGSRDVAAQALELAQRALSVAERAETKVDAHLIGHGDRPA